MFRELQSMTRRHFIDVTLLFLFFFFVIMAFWVLKPLRTSGVIKAFGPKYYPLFKQGILLIIPLIILAYTTLTCFLSRKHLVYAITVFFFGSMALLWHGFTVYEGQVLSAVFYFFVDAYITVMVTLFWSYANDYYQSDEARRYYGFVGAGGLLGGILGAWVSGWMSEVLGYHLLLVAMACLLPIFFIIYRLEKDRPGGQLRPVCEEGSKSHGEALTEGFRVVMTSRYLLGIVALVGLYEVISTIVDFQFNAEAAENFATAETMAAFHGKVFFVAQVASLAVQVILTTWVLRRFGVMAGLLFLPAALLAGSAGFMLFPVLSVISVTIGMETAFSYSINQSSKEVLYVPLDKARKYKGKAFIDMFVFKGAKALGAAFLLFYTFYLQDLGYSRQLLSLINVVALFFWILVVFSVGRAFKKKTEKNVLAV